MLTFLRSNWLVITICLVYTLIATGAAYYFTTSATHEHETVLLKMAAELKTAKETQTTANTEAIRAKAALAKEKALNAKLNTTLATAEQERESLRSSLETMASTVAKAAKTQVAKTKTPPVIAATTCRDKTAAAEKDLKNQTHALQAFQAEVYKRDSELRERQKKLDEALAKLAEENRKLEQGRAEYRWPHNSNQKNK